MRRYRENILWHRGAQKICESRAAPTRVKTAIIKDMVNLPRIRLSSSADYSLAAEGPE